MSLRSDLDCCEMDYFILWKDEYRIVSAFNTRFNVNTSSLILNELLLSMLRVEFLLRLIWV